MERREKQYEHIPRIDEHGNALVQLFNILLESVALDKKHLKDDVTKDI